MKRKRHSPEQIIAKLREADAMLATGAPIGQICQKLEVAEPTFHRWRNQYGGMKAQEAKRLKELEIENTRLKKLVADLSLDKQILEAYTTSLSMFWTLLMKLTLPPFSPPFGAPTPAAWDPFPTRTSRRHLRSDYARR